MSKKRSPAHPSVGLEAAIERTDTLYKKEGEHFIPMDAVAAVWKLSTKASGFLQLLSSLKQYGLLEEKGAKENRQFKLTSSALDITLHPENATQRLDAIKEAALLPSIHQEIWDKYNGKLPTEDASIQSYLLRGREGATFNRNQVDPFISRFRETLRYGGLLIGDKKAEDASVDSGNNGNDLKTPPSVVQVGSYVQCTSQGGHRFPEPKKVAGIDGEWAFVEGSPTGIPMTELLTVDPPKQSNPETPPTNPFFNPQTERDETPGEGIALDRTTLDEGTVRLEWPDDLSEDSVEEFQDWMVSRINRARRKAGLPKIKIEERE